MTATNMCSNFVGKWYSPPKSVLNFSNKCSKPEAFVPLIRGCHVIFFPKLPVEHYNL